MAHGLREIPIPMHIHWQVLSSQEDSGTGGRWEAPPVLNGLEIIEDLLQ